MGDGRLSLGLLASVPPSGVLHFHGRHGLCSRGVGVAAQGGSRDRFSLAALRRRAVAAIDVGVADECRRVLVESRGYGDNG